MENWIFWLIASLIAASLIAATIIVLVSGRRQRALESAQAAALEGTAEPVVPEILGTTADTAPEAVGGEGTAGVVSGGDAPVPIPPAESKDQPGVAALAPEVPEAPLTRLSRLRRRLAGSDNALARGLANLLSRDRLDEETWEDFETALITSDLGVTPASELIANLRRRLALDAVADPAQAKAVLREELITLTDPSLDRQLHLDAPAGSPAVILLVGVNGTGKTTTAGKLARLLVAGGKQVLLGAADTFRAAAADQLQTWGERIGVATVRGPEKGDPAAVAYDAVSQGQAQGIDVVIVDTAGRLHNKANLMEELGKVKRVIEKITPVSETLLVIDATTGQNALAQAKVFAQVVQISGIVLTKLDGSAKGGIVVAVQRELGVPVKFIGLGEGADDLAPFDEAQFVDGLLDQ